MYGRIRVISCVSRDRRLFQIDSRVLRVSLTKAHYCAFFWAVLPALRYFLLCFSMWP